MIDCEACCDELAETLAWIHASVEVEPQKDGTYLITCLDHPLCQDFTRKPGRVMSTAMGLTPSEAGIGMALLTKLAVVLRTLKFHA